MTAREHDNNPCAATPWMNRDTMNIAMLLANANDMMPTADSRRPKMNLWVREVFAAASVQKAVLTTCANG
eukprot:3638468-Rhodomonas_salina.2